MNTEIRVCSKCMKPKNLINDFFKSKNSRLGRNTKCKRCVNDYASFRFQVRCKLPKVRFNTYVSSAKRRNLEFKLEFDYFNSLLSKPCFYCGDNGYMGVDRMNNDSGYNYDNCVPCCKRCNLSKGVMNSEQYISHCLKVVNYSHHEAETVSDVELITKE